MTSEPDPIFDSAAFEAVIGAILTELLGGDGAIGSTESRSGTFNRVIKFTYQGRRLGVRLALDRRHFRYERDLIKEVFAIALMKRAGAPLDDEETGREVEALLAAPRGRLLGHEAVRTILYYDWSMERLPYAFFLFEWIEGAVLWEQPFADRYEAAGRVVAGLHKVRFEHFYENILTIHHVPRSWRDHLRVCLNRELARAELNLPEKLVARLNAMDLGVVLQPGQPCLIHNDYSGANIIVDPGGSLHVIDWDNWVVDCAELDLVKMKHWTAVGTEGRLMHKPELYGAFLEGYRSAADNPIDEGRLRAYEYLWLLRCFNFETSREGSGETGLSNDSWRHVYPRARYYLDLLESL
ncbi:MAG TPA: phosphotransferase [Magnetospirillaceae bacterium]|nr:phosphotransferase [Magnetospirillaceae bacterium]